MKQKYFILFLSLIGHICLFAQQNTGYEDFFKKILATGIKPEVLSNMNQEQVIKYAKEHNIDPPGAPTGVRPIKENKLGAKAPAAVPEISTSFYLKNLPDFGEPSQKFKEFQIYIDAKKLNIEQEQNKIAAADALAKYAPSGSDAEVLALKKIMGFQQNEDGTNASLIGLQNKKAELHKSVEDSMHRLILKRNAYMKNLKPEDMNLTPFTKEAHNFQLTTYFNCQKLYAEFKNWYILNTAKADAILKEINMGVNLTNMSTRTGARGIQNQFYGSAISMLNLRVELLEMLTTVILN